MFKTKLKPTFAAQLTIAGQGTEQKLNLVYRHKKRSEYGQLFKDLSTGATKAEDVVLAIVDSWEAEAELTVEGVRELLEEQPGLEWAIVQGYGQALGVALKGN